MKSFTVFADMGSVKIHMENGAAFLNNGIGDGFFTVTIGEKGEEMPKEYDAYAGYFEIYQAGHAVLMNYDCADWVERHKRLYSFMPGRYFAQHDDNGDIFIQRFND